MSATGTEGAARTLADRIPWPWRTRPTGRSTFVFVASFLLFVGIQRTHDNLLYLLLAILATYLAVGWLGPILLAGRLRITRRVPGEIHAESEVALDIELTNTSRTFRSPAVVITDADRVAGAGGTPALIESLAPGAATRFRIPMIPHRRGLWRMADMRLVSSFPVGLFERELVISDNAELLVYPRVVRVRDRFLEGVAVNPSRFSALPDTEREIQSLRAYHEGDDLRRVNWKATARRDDLIVGEYHKLEKRAKVAIYLDLVGGGDAAVEDAISLTASLALFYRARNRLIKLVTSRDVITFGRSERKIKAMLKLLALLGPEDRVPIRHRPRDEGFCLKVMVHTGKPPRFARQCDVTIGPRDYQRYAPGLKRGAKSNG